MPAPGITVLKNNVPWGPFTREQIDDGLKRGDFTVRYLAHAPGLKEWLPLDEVLDYVDRGAGARSGSLPPVPEPRELPPVPETAEPETKPAPISTERPARPPVLPATFQSAPSPPLSLPPVAEKPEIAPKPESELETAPLLLRGIAFLIDGAILFLPVGILFIFGALAIEIPRLWSHTSAQSLTDEWELLDQNVRRLAWLLFIAFGWLYLAGQECSPAQATVGKRWVGIVVTDMHGERISFLRATGRYAAKYLSALPCFLGFIMALFSSRNLTLHDRLSGTRVVKK
jgi:uncharacterized RDD family membrane protein YckC